MLLMSRSLPWQIPASEITLTPSSGANYDALRVIEHEIDEVLGVGGAGSLLGTAYTANYSGILDLYRYSAPGVASYSTASNATAYYSIDGA